MHRAVIWVGPGTRYTVLEARQAGFGFGWERCPCTRAAATFTVNDSDCHCATAHTDPIIDAVADTVCANAHTGTFTG